MKDTEDVGIKLNLRKVVYMTDKELNGLTPPKTISFRQKNRWKLFVGASRSLLPRVLPGLGVDLFLHDSDHSYDNMLFEFECVWPFIRPGGVLASDDAIGHDALLDFCDSVGCAPIIVKDAPPHAFGAVRKLRAQPLLADTL